MVRLLDSLNHFSFILGDLLCNGFITFHPTRFIFKGLRFSLVLYISAAEAL